jgi:hypothetical protein
MLDRKDNLSLQAKNRYANLKQQCHSFGDFKVRKDILEEYIITEDRNIPIRYTNTGIGKLSKDLVKYIKNDPRWQAIVILVFKSLAERVKNSRLIIADMEKYPYSSNQLARALYIRLQELKDSYNEGK